MKNIKIGTNRLISVVLSIVMCATILTGAIWALSNLFKTGMSIVVTYDPLVNAKVYLSTDSSGAETADLKQLKSEYSNITANNFVKENSALVLNTTGNSENGGAQSKTDFETLGNSDGLICDANGEMEFYVYVENFSETESVYYSANITFGNTEETTPFNVVKNPRYGVSEAVSDSTGGGGVTSSLLAFKIALNSEFEDIPADSLTIKIKLQTVPNPSWLIAGPYTTGNYAGLYYLDFGEHPQSLHGTSLPEGTNTTPNEKDYYENPTTGLKYAKKGTNYYLVEPVRWLVIGNGSGLNGKGFPDKNGNGGADLASNQLLLLSEKTLTSAKYHNNRNVNVSWTASTMYTTALPNLKNKLFNSNEMQSLGTFDEGSQLSLLSYDYDNYKYSTYCSTSVLKCERTSFSDNTYNQRYWLRTKTLIKIADSWKAYHIELSSGTMNGSTFYDIDYCIRPIIILNVD